MLGRRSFLSMLAGTAGALALDPERALWTPGKLISIPKSREIYNPAMIIVSEQWFRSKDGWTVTRSVNESLVEIHHVKTSPFYPMNGVGPHFVNYAYPKNIGVKSVRILG